MSERKIVEIEGKKYVEFDEDKFMKYSKKRDIVFLILIAFAIIGLIFAITTLIKNKDIINKDALAIGMEQHGFVNCQCTDDENKKWQSKNGGFIYQEERRFGIDLNRINASGLDEIIND